MESARRHANRTIPKAARERWVGAKERGKVGESMTVGDKEEVGEPQQNYVPMSRGHVAAYLS